MAKKSCISRREYERDGAPPGYTMKNSGWFCSLLTPPPLLSSSVNNKGLKRKTKIPLLFSEKLNFQGKFALVQVF